LRERSRRLLWFFVLWLAGVGVLATLAFVTKLLLGL
jgi:hypothetical protein